jgi:hypothetical protein
VPKSAQPQTSISAAQPRQRRPAAIWIGRAGGILFGVLLAWLLAEVVLRLFFFSLPPRMQLVLDEVHKTPFTHSKLLPDPIWQSDTEYLMITRPVHDYTAFGTAEVRFKVSTETLWGSRVAFRTRQDLVDRYVDGVAVGDSFTFCFTEEDQCWVERLGQLTNRNLINLGLVSTGSVSHERVLAHFGMPLKPPLVIWQWFGNDANEDYGLASLRGETTVKSPNPPPPIPKLNWWDKNSAVYVLLKLYLGSESQFDASLQFLDSQYARTGNIRLAFGRPYLWNAFDMSLPNNLDGWARGQQAFLEARDMVQSYGGTLVIILMPTKEQVYRDLSEPLLGQDKLALLDKPYQMMLDFCQQQSLTCIDLLPILQKYAAAGEQLYYTTDMHLNARGNEVLAEELAAWLAVHPEIFAKQGS